MIICCFLFSFILDINECVTHLHNCSQNAICHNTKGSHTCTCKPGFTGNGHKCEGNRLFPGTKLVYKKVQKAFTNRDKKFFSIEMQRRRRVKSTLTDRSSKKPLANRTVCLRTENQTKALSRKWKMSRWVLVELVTKLVGNGWDAVVQPFVKYTISVVGFDVCVHVCFNVFRYWRVCWRVI